MGLKSSFKIAEELRRIRNVKHKQFLKTIPLPKGSNLHKEASSGDNCIVAAKGFYPLERGDVVGLFCQDTSFAVMVLITEVFYPLLDEVSVRDIVHLGCSSQEDLLEIMSKQHPGITPNEMITLIKCEVK